MNKNINGNDYQVVLIGDPATGVPTPASGAILVGATTATAGPAVAGVGKAKTYQADGVTTAGTGGATVQVQGSNNNGASWDTIGTITLTLGTTITSDSFSSNDRYSKLRGNVTALSGTGASVNLTMGY